MRRLPLLAVVLTVAGLLVAVPGRRPLLPISASAPQFEVATDRVGLAATPTGRGYWIADANGAVVALGDAPTVGDLRGVRLTNPVVAIAAPASGHGYWLADSAGGVRAFGVADRGSVTRRLAMPVVGMAPTPSGNGYWLVASDGGIFSFGDAAFLGSTGGMRLNRPIVGMAATRSGNGYWLVASDGGIFSFGDAAFLGSTGAMRLNRPIVGMAASRTGGGYRIVASDGGIFDFGDAAFAGSLGSSPPPAPVVGVTESAGGYWLLDRSGHAYAFGGAVDAGSAPGSPHGVGIRTVTVTDPARPTPARGSAPAHRGRTLVTTVVYPADVPASGGETQDARPSTTGPFPLVVFAHGFAVTPLTYRVVLDGWAQAGYVVAAPEFPISGADGSGPPGRWDLAEQPGDMSAVIGYMTAATRDPSSWLAGVVDAGRIAEAGQSDGGSTVAAASLNSAAHDPRLTAAIVMSGAELAMAGGSYGTTANVPVLVVQGSSDPVNPPGAAVAVYNDARAPKGYLDVIGSGHLQPYLDPGFQAGLVRAAMVDFLDLELKGEIDGLLRLRVDGGWPGETSLVSSFS